MVLLLFGCTLKWESLFAWRTQMMWYVILQHTAVDSKRGPVCLHILWWFSSFLPLSNNMYIGILATLNCPSLHV